MHGHIDGSTACTASAINVNPHCRVGEVDEVIGGDVHHAVVGQLLAAVLVGVVVQVRGPIDHVLADFLVVVGLRRPSVACVIRAHLDVALLGPVDQIVGLPNLNVLGTVSLCTSKAIQPVEGGTTVNLQIGGEHVELVAVLGLHDERIAQTLLAKLGSEYRRAVVQRVPVERIVALGGREADFLAAHALAGEERPHVGLVLLFGGRHRLNGDGEGLRFGGGTVLGNGFERHSDGIATGGRALNSDRSRFVVHAFA